MVIFKTRTTIFDLLKRDHDEVSRLFDDIFASSDTQEARRLFGEIRQKLAAHSVAEEQVFYSRLRDEETTRDIVLEALEEHVLVRRLLNELDRTTIDAQWRAKLGVLQANIEHHVWEEEHMLFARAKAVIDPQEAERMGKAFSGAKEEALGQPVAGG